MKAVLISIQPKWCELIASGKKTVEIRKTRPKIEPPFKVYIYQTRKPVSVRFSGTGPYISEYDITRWYTKQSGKVIGEFVCDSIIKIGYNKNGYGLDDLDIHGVIAKSCILEKKLYHYLQGKIPYCWHISDLVIYDKPKELSEFRIEDKMAIRQCNHRFRYGQPESVTQHGGWIKGGFGCMKSGEPEWCEICLTKPLTRPPQSWCYVEEVQKCRIIETG